MGGFLRKEVEVDPSTIADSHFLFARFHVEWSSRLLDLKSIPLEVGDNWIEFGVSVEVDPLPTEDLLPRMLPFSASSVVSGVPDPLSLIIGSQWGGKP